MRRRRLKHPAIFQSRELIEQPSGATEPGPWETYVERRIALMPRESKEAYNASQEQADIVYDLWVVRDAITQGITNQMQVVAGGKTYQLIGSVMDDKDLGKFLRVGARERIN